MTIRKKQPKEEIVIDITGPEGNAFVLMGYAMKFGRQLGFNAHDCAKVQEEMTSGDYENLLEVFDKYFGHFVVLER